MNDRMIDWLIGAALCALLWFAGYSGQRARETNQKEVRVPQWLAWFSGGRSINSIRINSFGFQLLGIALLGLNTALALLVQTHSARIDLLAMGLMVLLVLVWLITEVMRKH